MWPRAVGCLTLGPARGIRHWWRLNASAPAAVFRPQTSLPACWRSPQNWHGKRGLNNVDTRVVDAQRLDLDPDSFDAAVSRNCLMLIPDYQQALTNIRRVLKPGGRFAAIVFSTPDRCPYLSLPHAIVFRVGRLASPAPERFGEFRLGARGILEDAYRTAGFREISVHTVPTRRRFPSLGEAMQYARGPFPCAS